MIEATGRCVKCGGDLYLHVGEPETYYYCINCVHHHADPAEFESREPYEPTHWERNFFAYVILIGGIGGFIVCLLFGWLPDP